MTGPQKQTGWIGTGVSRLDLEPLVRGVGTYTADVTLPGTLDLAAVRSPHAHARITRLDLQPALACPGVAAVFGPDEAAGIPGIPILSVVPGQRQDRYPLFAPKALYVGQALAVVAAPSRYLAEDAAEAVAVAYEPLPAVGSALAGLAVAAPLLYPEWSDNIAARAELTAGDVAQGMAAADFVIAETFQMPRQMAVPMETRCILAQFTPRAGTLTVWYSTQAPGPFRTYLSQITGLAEDRIQIIVPRVGGAFGNKLHYFPEEVAACLLAVRLGRPVRFVEDRREHFAATVHSREQTIRVQAGVRRDGTLTALEAFIATDAGACLHTKGNAPAWLTARMLPGPYRLANYRCQCVAVVTNKTPHGAYRGFGQPEAVFVHERIMDTIAGRLGLDPAEVRRRNLITATEMPYRSGGQLVYDSGDFPALLTAAQGLADYDGLRRRQAAVRTAGGLYGVGLAAVVEYTAMGPSPVMAMAGNQQGGYESAVVRIGPAGTIACHTGLIELGQGTTTALAQICADHLGVTPEQVHVYSGDTQLVPYSIYGTAASRGAAVAGGAMVLACRQLRDKIRHLAAHLLGLPGDEVTLAAGQVGRPGGPLLSLAEVAMEAWRARRLPAGMEPGLEAKAIYDPPNWTYSSQVHVVACAVDRETGQVRIDDYALAHDCGTMLNPRLVEDQLVGGIAQGLGAALLEELVYDDSGQLLCGTFAEYPVPTAPDMPNIRHTHLCTPSPHIPGGMKGMGEGGLIAGNIAIVSAIADALAPLGVTVTTYPLPPPRILALIRDRPP